MRRGFGLIGLLVTVIVVATVGVIAYQAGWSEGFAQHLPAGTTAPAPGQYPYYYGGAPLLMFGLIYGLMVFLFFVWVFFLLLVFGARVGRRTGPGWSDGHR